MKYILKDKSEVESIPIGRAKIKIGETINRLTVCDRGPNGKGQNQGLFVNAIAAIIQQ